jgi:DNA replication protein DnaC
LVSEFVSLAEAVERATGRSVRAAQPSLDRPELLVDLVGLPPTAQLEEQAGRAVMRLFDACPDHADREPGHGDARHRQLVDQVERLDRRLAQARTRDRLAAEAGCWCLGLGGRHEVGLVREGRFAGVGFAEYCACPAGQRVRADHRAAADRLWAEHERRRRDRLWDSVPEAFRGVSLDSYPAHRPEQRRTLDVLRAWLPSGAWLYLHGPVGRGKSSLAIAAAAELGEVALYVSVPRMLTRLRATYDGDGREGEVLDSLYGVPILILDDLGKEKRSDWACEKLFQVIDERWANHRRTIVTSNFDIGALEDRLGEAGEAVASRIRGAARPFLVFVDGPDLRQVKENA